MKEVRVIRYQADDGKMFDNAQDCRNYEADIALGEGMKRAFNKILDYCANHVDEEADDYEGHNICTNEECVFHDIRCEYRCTFSCLPYIDMDRLE